MKLPDFAPYSYDLLYNVHQLGIPPHNSNEGKPYFVKWWGCNSDNQFNGNGWGSYPYNLILW